MFQVLVHKLSLAGMVGVLLVPYAAGAGTLTTIYSFTGGSDGANPTAALIEVGGSLFGVTPTGGTPACTSGSQTVGCGVIFKIELSSGAETTLYAFPGGAGGASPNGGLSYINGFPNTLFGTTGGGGKTADGTTFKVNSVTGKIVLLHSFDGKGDGAGPIGNLTDVGGLLYGTTYGGGANGAGTAFRVDPISGDATTLYGFPSGVGTPALKAGVTQASSFLYGITGEPGEGIIFKTNPVNGATKQVHVFQGGSDGSFPSGSLLDIGGTLFGTTNVGGTYGKGTVYEFTPKTGVEKVVYSFGGPDGKNPTAGLISVAGVLYGTTSSGGASNLSLSVILCAGHNQR
jgi:uncharacterized repeat protein (TIGR03803 family)